MLLTEKLKIEMQTKPEGEFCPSYFKSIGYKHSSAYSPAIKRAEAVVALFTEHTPFIYKSDLIVGSICPFFLSLSEDEKTDMKDALHSFPERIFFTNADHFSPDYETAVKIGISGLISRIEDSKQKHEGERDAIDLLLSMQKTLEAFCQKLLRYAALAASLAEREGYYAPAMRFIEKNCTAISQRAPESFAEALQLVWMIHSSFFSEGRNAMALGRMDQYLYPFYKSDIERGVLTKGAAQELIENALVKICEGRYYLDDDDVVNICIGGVDAEGRCAVNELSYCILHAVRDINLPGPNLSARIAPDCPDEFLDECLKVIGTGLGYPALMNDSVNMAALLRMGYAEKDVRNYTMVGCIENFMTGKQPPWSDSRFDAPRFIENTLLCEKGGLGTDELLAISSMEEFMKELKNRLVRGVHEHMESVYKKSEVTDPANMTSPFMSVFCEDCIGRARDINMGGAIYPSVHGAVLMGVGTMSDSLAAIEKVVFRDKEATLFELSKAMRANFEGYEELRNKLIAAPKYGNNDDFVDKYAVWFTEYLTGLFDKYRTHDGGAVYTAMAANISNISAGKRIGATPDGRLAAEPLSDAASPTYGRDVKGATSTLLSLSKPDYTLCACGTVVNQKFSPSMFLGEKRQKLLQLIKVYFAKGGQEIQINATSTELLRDAMEHPEKHGSLVVRVSGFSALYVTLSRDVQKDILRRTQQA